MGHFIVRHVACWDKTLSISSNKSAKTGDDSTANNESVTDVANTGPKSHLSDGVSKISTGLGFLDHMIDQLNSHAQIGVSITVGFENDDSDRPDEKEGALKNSGKNRYSDADQGSLMELVGRALGEQLHPLALPMERRKTPIKTRNTSRFCCPLDEALVECQITITSPPDEDANDKSTGPLVRYDLAPYGSYPKNAGRSRIGQMETNPLEKFWTSLAEGMKLDSLVLKKSRGENGHHIVESSFKAFSRAFRCLIDGTSQEKMEVLWGKQSEGFAQGVALAREASLKRSTKETSIDVQVKLDGGAGRTHIDTGIPLLDEIYQNIADQCTSLTLQISCQGDLWVDDHHTSEDVSIAVGQCLREALGSKAGLNRMWTSGAKEGANSDLELEVVMDLSNRPCFTHNFDFGSSSTEETSNGMSLEMVVHAFDSLVMNSLMTVHVVQKSNNKDIPGEHSNFEARAVVLATARAFGAALDKCIAVDPRRSGKTASSKGTLSA